MIRDVAQRGGTLDNLLTTTPKLRRPVNRGRLWTVTAGAVLFCSLGCGPVSAQEAQSQKAKLHVAKADIPRKTDLPQKADIAQKADITQKAGVAKKAGVPHKTAARIKDAHHHTGQFSGLASFYDKDYSGKTASGARYDGRKFTAAHRTLPFGTRVRVTDKSTHRSVTVIVNDRGPFIKGRVIDLSYAAARALRMEERGLVQVTASIE